jgi:hypothetical protein
MIRWTTNYHLLGRLIFLVLAFTCWGVFGAVIVSIAQAYFNASKDNEIYYAYIPAGILSILVAVFLDEKVFILNDVATFLYIRNTLKTDVSLEEAKRLTFLFSGNNNGKWYPMEEIRKLPKESRREHLFERASSIAGFKVI